MTPKTSSIAKTEPLIGGRRAKLGADVRLFNRELSWLSFNERVFAEASRADIPILERLKFLAIFESNLDEFFMVRVSGLIDQMLTGHADTSPDGLTPAEQVKVILKQAKPLREAAGGLLRHELLPALDEAGISIVPYSKVGERHREELNDYFRKEVFPLCTPLLLHPAPTLPFISNRSLNILAVLKHDDGENRLARVKVPSILPRAVRLSGRKIQFVLLEDLIRHCLDSLFPGTSILSSHMFRVVRDADIEIKELEAADLISSVEETLRRRRFGDPVLLEIERGADAETTSLMAKLLDLEPGLVFETDGILGWDVLNEIAGVDRPQLKFRPFAPYIDPGLADSRSIFDAVSRQDVLLHHPYESFRPVEEFCGSAAVDPQVIGIKQTLYRVGTKSPIVEGLMSAAEQGKQVAAMVELKARFDENNNLGWARALEQAGAHVSYGFADTKTHCKVCLIVRRERGGIRQYAHIGTGNYNPATARLYSDLGLFTCSQEVTEDIGELFNFLTGFSRLTKLRRLLAAPVNLRERMLELIHDEAAVCRKTGHGRIAIKANSVVDPEAIEALYEASRAGVKVDLVVRGICCLRPGIPGLSENIRVVSIVGRFLEHSRIYRFENGGKPITYIGSADLMRRNLDRRIEVLVPVEQADLAARLEQILDDCLKDTVQAWDLLPNGEYARRPGKGKPFSAQERFMAREGRDRHLLSSGGSDS